MLITIIGAGKIGKALTQHLLEEGHSITVIDDDHLVLDEVINNYDVSGIEGNGASIDIQREANVGSSDLVIAVTSSDEVNMICCAVAKKLGAQQAIARVRNPEYSNQVYLMRNELGLSMVVNPELDAARDIARLLRFPSALKIDTFANGKVDIVEIKIENGNPLIGLSLADIYRKYLVRVLFPCVKRGEEVIIPKGDFVVQEGDDLYISSTQAVLARFFKALKIYKEKSNNIMIIGGGMIGYYLTRLVQDDGYNIKIIEQDPIRAQELSGLLPKALIINADGAEKSILQQENFANMDAVVTLTGMDEENMFLSVEAKHEGVKQVITKINRTTYKDVLNTLNIDCVITPSLITADHIITYVRGMKKRNATEFRTLYRFLDNSVEGTEFYISSETKYTNVPFKDLKLKNDVLIAAIIRDNAVIIPNGNDCLMPNDNVIVFARATQISDLTDILR